MKYRYIYKGTTEVNIPYVGTFQPGQEVEVDKPINHPDFEEVKEEGRSYKKKEK